MPRSISRQTCAVRCTAPPLTRWIGLWCVLAIAVCLPRTSLAQFLDPDTKVFCWHCNSHNAHFIGGATADAALHVMPFVKKSWETPAGRIATVAIGGVGLELADYVHCRQTHSCGREDAGFGFVDLGYDVAGAVATELLIAGLKHVPGLKRLL